MGYAMDELVKYMDKTDKVRIVAKDTDVKFFNKRISSCKMLWKKKYA